MQKKKDKLLDKIVKKNYNNQLEEVLEKKYFDENVKSILLSILYKIETAYKDYEMVKQNVETKEEFIEKIITQIKNNCDDIKIVKLNSKESEMLQNRTFLVEKEKKRIICYPIERKLLYCINKISKNEKIIKDDYLIISKTLSDLINTGNNINQVEPMRDFNGYSWTTLPREIESIEHNLIYQNLILLVGNRFLNNWINNKQFIMDYMELFKNKLDDKYGTNEEKELIDLLSELSVLLSIKFDDKLKRRLKTDKEEVDKKLDKLKDNKEFVKKITEEKRKLTESIKNIDETVNNKEALQKEYEKRNEELPIQEKIFSIRILSKMMIEERTTKIERLENLNNLLKPKNFVKYKKTLEQKHKYLQLVEVKNIEKEIETNIIEFQKVFLSCYKSKIQKAETKQELLKLIYEFRYYCLLPFNKEKEIRQIKELYEPLQEIGEQLIQKAHELKIIDVFSKNKNIDYQILKNIFYVRVINLENLYLKIVKEKDNYYIQLFDEDVFEEKIEIEDMNNLNKKDLEIKVNKKIKIFN